MAALPPLAAIRAFEAAARHQNYSRAAEELAMTQAGISYQIKVLEDRLGAHLFQRHGRGVALTALGRRIAPRVSEAFDALEQAFAAARAENESVLQITVPHTFAANWLAPRIGAFNLAHPQLAVRLDVSNTLVDLANSEFDVAIRGVFHPPADCVSHFIMRQHVTPMASPAFLARHPVSSPADLLLAPRLSPDDEWWSLWFGLFDDLAFDPAGATGTRFDSQVLDGAAALAGHGFAALSPIMFADALDSGALIQVFPQIAVEPRGFWLAYPEHKRRLAKVRAFRDWLLQAARDAAGDDPDGLLEPMGAD